jgi:transcription-repair coupling factor (superfamily II helicase)
MSVKTNILDIPPSRAHHTASWQRLYGSSLGLAIAELSAGTDHLTIAVTEDAQSAQKLFNQIRFYSAQDQVVFVFPDWECLPYDQFSPHADIISQRLSVLRRMPGLSNSTLVLPVSNLMQRLAPRTYVDARSFFVQTGETVDLAVLRGQLQELSYHAVSQVLEPGEFCVRGGLIDIFPTGSKRPFRLDLFDDQVDTIRYFDPDSQRSSEAVDQISLLPAREIPLDDAGIKQFRKSFRASFAGDPSKYDLYRDVSNGLFDARVSLKHLLIITGEREGCPTQYLTNHDIFNLNVV